MVLTVTHPSSVSSLRSSTPVPLLALRATSPGAGESFPQGVKASAETANIPYDTYEFWRFTDFW